MIAIGQRGPDSPDPDCRCDICEWLRANPGRTRDEAVAAWEERKIAEVGWIAHYHHPYPRLPTATNAHTHGLPERYGHPDVQVVGRVDLGLATKILANAVAKVARGERLEEWATADGILFGECRLVYVIPAAESGREVLRLILPDEAGRLLPHEIAEPYSWQYAPEIPPN